jgi:hypothetical protein
MLAHPLLLHRTHSTGPLIPHGTQPTGPPISGRGGGTRTPIPGFGDRSPSRWTTPLYPEPAESGRRVYPSRALSEPAPIPVPPLHKLKLFLPVPTLNFLFPLPSRLRTPAKLAPNQLNRSPLRRKSRPNSPVVPLSSLLYILRNSNIERTILTPHHVAEPICICLRHMFSASIDLRHSSQAKPESRANLLHFLMPGMLPARIAEFPGLHALRVLPLILRRRVVAILAIAALQSNDFPHSLIPPAQRPRFSSRSKGLPSQPNSKQPSKNYSIISACPETLILIGVEG